MAKKKTSTPIDEKFEKQDFNLFEAIEALDRKDYGYYDRLSPEQQKKFVPYMMLFWMSTIKGQSELQNYYLRSVDYYANKYIFNEHVMKHPKLQWLMLCSTSPGMGKQFHQWIPHIKDKVSKYKEPAQKKEINDFFNKIYPKADKQTLSEISETYVVDQKRKTKLATLFPNLKTTDIDVLNNIISDDDISSYERDLGNQ